MSETACIFRGIPLQPSLRAAPPPRPPSVRLSRAALVAFGTGTLSLAAACGGAIAGSAAPADAGRDAGATAAPDGGDEDSGTFIGTSPPYGAFPIPDSGEADSGTNEPPKDAAIDSPGIAPPYGAPPGH